MDDYWPLQTVTSLNFARSQSMFSYATPKVWNWLPLSLREIANLSLFKKRLKAFYFSLVFEDITKLFDANILLLITVELVRLLCVNFISINLFECYYGPLVRCIDTYWCYIKGDINCNFYYCHLNNNNLKI